MAEYTYKDVIIDPTSEEAKNCIGKKVYMADSPSACLKFANKSYNDYCRTLLSINDDAGCPFISKSGLNYGCIILLKEESKPEYVPFDTIEEFVKASSIHNKDHYLAGTGIWLKKLRADNIPPACMIIVSGFYVYDNTIFVDDNWLDLKEVLDLYVFLDDTPCGKLNEADNG